MYDLMANEHQALQVISRFGLPLGVGDKTIEMVCVENNIDYNTFLAVINHQFDANIDLSTLIKYLQQSHTYFFEFALPKIRSKLIESINLAANDNQIPILIIKFYDEYVQEIKLHMQHENLQLFPYIQALIQGKENKNLSIDKFAHQHSAIDDIHIANKLSELKNLIIKYYPYTGQNNLLISALYDILQTEQELAHHCSIEDNLLFPAVKRMIGIDQQTIGDECEDVSNENCNELSDREKEVLIHLVNGMSNKEIANALCISTHTVISHRKNLTKKLNIHSVAGLTIYAIVHNLINIE
ncbi:MAG: hemerythrin domain-containing protein [Paludibacteraceae bacterium]|nr:hemerythrin domain-containing protein [Paludibacteraceae bacterium]